jgi:hypothetical protein
MNNTFHFPHQLNNTLLSLLKDPEFASALAYMVDYKNHFVLDVIPKEFSIELSNQDITIAIIIYSGFEKKEYGALLNRNNLHLISLCDSVNEMFEFEGMDIKIIDKMAWLFSVINWSERNFAKRLRSLKSLNIGY